MWLSEVIGATIILILDVMDIVLIYVGSYSVEKYEMKRIKELKGLYIFFSDRHI